MLAAGTPICRAEAITHNQRKPSPKPWHCWKDQQMKEGSHWQTKHVNRSCYQSQKKSEFGSAFHCNHFPSMQNFVFCFWRFVGLLLAANTLPAHEPQKLQQVYEAAGAAFFDRLLLPLRSQKASPLTKLPSWIRSFKSCTPIKMCNFAEALLWVQSGDLVVQIASCPQQNANFRKHQMIVLMG